MTSCSRVES